MTWWATVSLWITGPTRADLLQVNRKFLGTEGASLFRDWIRNEIESNTPYDSFARKILTAKGSNKENPAASYYKILREPDAIMENTTHLFWQPDSIATSAMITLSSAGPRINTTKCRLISPVFLSRRRLARINTLRDGCGRAQTPL